MDKGQKRSFDQIEQQSPPTAEEYVYSANDHLHLEQMAATKTQYRPTTHTSLDAIAKIAALKASPSVVSLVCFSGEALISQCSGTIIEVEENNNIVLTSLHLLRQPTDEEVAENKLADNLKIIIHSYDDCSYMGEILTYDFHYNILFLKFKSKISLKPAKLSIIVDDIGLDNSFQLRPHALKVKARDPVVVVGRYFYRSFDLVAFSGCLRMKDYSRDDSDYDCKELMFTNCLITTCADGGPLINLDGEVLGIAFFDLSPASRFLPINFLLKLWNVFKKFKELRHPSYGFEASNLYKANLLTLERLWKSSPPISNGLLVEKVWPGSYAESSGLRKCDIIIKCDGKDVRSFLELWDVMWDKVGQVLELEVFRVDLSTIMNISMMVGEACPNVLNNWPRFDYLDDDD